MFQTLLIFHSAFRWLVLGSLIWAIYKSVMGYRSKVTYTKRDNSLRHITATIAHVQLTLGILVYTQSPTVKYFLTNPIDGFNDTVFFGLVHTSLMLVAVIIITIGSAKAKRKTADDEKFKTTMYWFSLALLVIFIAIPWPFSPLAGRPYFRIF